MRSNLRVVINLLLIACFLVSCNSLNEKFNNTNNLPNTYENEYLGIKIDYPANWVYEENISNYSGDTVINIASGKDVFTSTRGPSGDFSSVLITATKKPEVSFMLPSNMSVSNSPEQLLDTCIRISCLLPFTARSDIQSLKISGMPAAMIEAQNKGENGLYQEYFVFISTGNIVYLLIFQTDAQYWQKYSDIFQQMISSIDLNPEINLNRANYKSTDVPSFTPQVRIPTENTQRVTPPVIITVPIKVEVTRIVTVQSTVIVKPTAIPPTKIPAPTYFKIYFKNNCNRKATFAIDYKNFDNDWVAKGWWYLDPGETNYVANTKNTIFYYYGQTEGGSTIYWKGTDVFKHVNDSKTTYGFKKVTIDLSSWGNWTQSFSCPN